MVSSFRRLGGDRGLELTFDEGRVGGQFSSSSLNIGHWSGPAVGQTKGRSTPHSFRIGYQPEGRQRAESAYRGGLGNARNRAVKRSSRMATVEVAVGEAVIRSRHPLGQCRSEQGSNRLVAKTSKFTHRN